MKAAIPMPAKANICGPKIARLRLKQRMTQSELQANCRRAGLVIARSSLAKIENGTRSVSDFELVALASAFGVNVPVLLSESGQRRAAKKHGKD